MHAGTQGECSMGKGDASAKNHAVLHDSQRSIRVSQWGTNSSLACAIPLHSVQRRWHCLGRCPSLRSL